MKVHASSSTGFFLIGFELTKELLAFDLRNHHHDVPRPRVIRSRAMALCPIVLTTYFSTCPLALSPDLLSLGHSFVVFSAPRFAYAHKLWKGTVPPLLWASWHTLGHQRSAVGHIQGHRHRWIIDKHQIFSPQV